MESVKQMVVAAQEEIAKERACDTSAGASVATIDRDDDSKAGSVAAASEKTLAPATERKRRAAPARDNVAPRKRAQAPRNKKDKGDVIVLSVEDFQTTDGPSLPSSSRDDACDGDVDQSFKRLIRKPTPPLASLYSARANAFRRFRAETARVATAQRNLEEAQAAYDAAIASASEAKASLEAATSEAREGELIEPSCRWNDMYQKLADYRKANGNTDVKSPEFYEKGSDLHKLSNWVTKQRKLNKRGTLKSDAPHRHKSLVDLGFSFNVYEKRWNERYRELVLHKERTGTSHIRRTDPTAGELGQWLDTQKSLYRMKKRGDTSKTWITDERIRLLQEVGCQLDARPTWDDVASEMEQHRARTGHCRPGQDPGRPQDKKLQKWVDDQRCHYARWRKGDSNHRLTEERRKRLDEIGFCWTRCQCEGARKLGRTVGNKAWWAKREKGENGDMMDKLGAD